VCLAVVYGFGIWAGQHLYKDSILWWKLAVLMTGLVFVLFLLREKLRFQSAGLLGIFILVIFFLLGVVSFQEAISPLANIRDEWDGRKAEISGRISSVFHEPDGSIKLLLTNVHLDLGQSLVKLEGGDFLLSVYPDYGQKNVHTSFQWGWDIFAHATIRRPQLQRNPGGFDHRAYLARRGILLTGYTAESGVDVRDRYRRKNFYQTIQAFRMKMEDHIDHWVAGEEGDILKGILLGSKEDISEDMRDAFSAVGVAHILAISGLHVGYLVLGVMKAAFWFHIPAKRAFWGIVILLSGYCLLTGLTPSVIRASIMAVILLGGNVLGRKTDPLSSLAAAFLAILLFRPLDLFEAGFQMSFGAVVGIFTLYKPFKNRLNRLPEGIKSALAVTLSAQAGVLPITIFYFHQLSLISLVANLLIVPLTGVVVIGGIITLLLTGLWAPLAYPILWLVKGSLRFMAGSTFLLSKIPYAVFYLPSFPSFIVVIYYCIIWIISPYLTLPNLVKKRLVASLALIVLLWMGMGWYTRFKGLEIIFIDVGQGDSILVSAPGGKHYLIDGGGSLNQTEGAGFDPGKHIIIPFLREKGIYHLDGVFLSHGHADHVGGLVTVLQEIPTAAIYQARDFGQGDAVYSRILAMSRERNIPIIELEAGDILSGGKDIRFRILYPDNGKDGDKSIDMENGNNHSLVMLLDCKGFRILFTGDIEKEVEDYLLSKGIEGVHVLKVAHHGSKTSSTPEWIDALSPRVAIIPVGKNQFGHPNEEVLQRFYDRGIQLFRTDQSGAVILRYENGSLKIKPFISN
jgi:competence protein ComEC